MVALIKFLNSNPAFLGAALLNDASQGTTGCPELRLDYMSHGLNSLQGNIHLSIYLSVYLPFYLSIYPSVYLSVYLSRYLAIYRIFIKGLTRLHKRSFDHSSHAAFVVARHTPLDGTIFHCTRELRRVCSL